MYLLWSGFGNYFLVTDILPEDHEPIKLIFLLNNSIDDYFKCPMRIKTQSRHRILYSLSSNTLVFLCEKTMLPDLTIWVTQRVSYFLRAPELTSDFVWVRDAHPFSFLCCFYCFCLSSFQVLRPMLPVSLDCPFLITLSVFSTVYLLDMCC